MRNLTILLILITSFTYAQEQVKGLVTDESGNSIAGVHLWIDNTTAGTITDRKGEYVLQISSFPVKIHVSHLSYKSVIINLKSINDIHKNIKLESLVYTLPSASVTGEKITDLTKGYLYDISDFEIYQDHILLLAYQWKRKQNPWLIMLSAYGDTLWSSYIGIDGELYKDCMGKIHLINKKAAYQIFIEEDNFQLYPPVSIDDFENLLKPCIESYKSKVYLEQYAYANQVLNYFEADLKDTSNQKIATIADRQALRWLQDDAMGLSPLRDEHEQRFESLFFYDPIYAPLIKRGDTTILFDFVNDEIGTYNLKFDEISSVNIDFHKTLKWKEKLFVDEGSQKIYTMYRRNGLHSLYEVNTWTGKLLGLTRIPKFTFVGKLRVHNGSVFFLYRDREEDQALTKIYQMFVE